MNIKNWATGALAAAVLLTAPAFAHDGDNKVGYDKTNREYSQHARYEWTAEPGQTIIFKRPVSFQGEVTGVNASHRMLKASNGMTIEVPNQALIWNGDTEMFAQGTALGDNVVIHMRQEEPYRVMRRTGDELAIGSYDGVFFIPADFIADIDLDNLDDGIYRDTAEMDMNMDMNMDMDMNKDGMIDDNERHMMRMHHYDNDLKSSDK